MQQRSFGKIGTTIMPCHPVTVDGGRDHYAAYKFAKSKSKSRHSGQYEASDQSEEQNHNRAMLEKFEEKAIP